MTLMGLAYSLVIIGSLICLSTLYRPSKYIETKKKKKHALHPFDPYRKKRKLFHFEGPELYGSNIRVQSYEDYKKEPDWLKWLSKTKEEPPDLPLPCINYYERSNSISH